MREYNGGKHRSRKEGIMDQEIRSENDTVQGRQLVNEMQIVFDSRSENEGFARTAVASFVMPLDPTIDELADIKTAVSEAVTNCIIHGYEMGPGKIFLDAAIWDRTLVVSITDEGRGIADIEKAMEPMFTTKRELERSGMGFSFMEAFMDALEVDSVPGRGTRVVMEKEIM